MAKQKRIIPLKGTINFFKSADGNRAKAMASAKGCTGQCRKNFMLLPSAKKLCDNLELLQQDLDQWMNYYNNERPHSGRNCYGKTPMQTFIESLSLAKQKLPDDIQPAA
jgi:hypothetical protein